MKTAGYIDPVVEAADRVKRHHKELVNLLDQAMALGIDVDIQLKQDEGSVALENAFDFKITLTQQREL
jgi:hypothetical protein